jgi:hypothetical protein
MVASSEPGSYAGLVKSDSGIVCIWCVHLKHTFGVSARAGIAAFALSRIDALFDRSVIVGIRLQTIESLFSG